MTALQTTTKTNGKAPPAMRGVTSPAPKSVDKATAAVLAASTVQPSTAPKGTVIDGIDCSGMIDDGKKSGIPLYLQTQNRRALSAEQKAKVAELQRAAKAGERAKAAERAAMAKQLGMSPTQMKKAGATLKSETAAKTPAKKSGKQAAPAAKTKPRKPDERARYDWAGAREAANKGKVPAAPDFSANTHRYYRPALAEVVKLVKAGDLKGLQAYRVQGSSTSPAAIKRYREIAIVALKASSK